MVLARQDIGRLADLPRLGPEPPSPVLLTAPEDDRCRIELLRQDAPDLVATGRGYELLAWVTSFPDRLAEREPWLLHYRAVALRLTSGDYATAYQLQERAQAIFSARADRAGSIRTLAELGLLAHLCQHPADARRFLARARTELAALDVPSQAAMLCTIVDVSQSPDRSAAATAHEDRPVTDSDHALLGHDQVIRARLLAALHDERLTPRGLRVLRQRYGLTPAETSVFIEYYLCRAQPAEHDDSKRQVLARRLRLSENTLMHHVTSIRRKLGFGARKGSAEVVLWSLENGITNLRPRVTHDEPEPVALTEPTRTLTRTLCCHPGWVAQAK